MVLYNFTCPINGSRSTSAFFASIPGQNVLGYDISIIVPVHWTTYQELWNGNLTLHETLNQGFDVVYNTEDVGCSACDSWEDHSKACLDQRGILYPPSHNWRRLWELPPIHYKALAPKRYSYSDVKKITNSFRDKLGQGGYGGVYKGKLLDGRLVAVKILNESKGNGEEFINEVVSISRTSHVNIVAFLEFCLESNKRALIYEFIPNGSLEKFINGENPLKNDEDFCPKISDFRLAKLCTIKESIVSMVGARGTIGYIAPKVFNKNFRGVSHKSDVYNYGMMVLEMVGGCKNVVAVDYSNEIYFPYWIYKCLEQDEDLGFHGSMTTEEKEIKRKMIFVTISKSERNLYYIEYCVK
ncbi:hypothetical protein ACSBR1_024871 [Camellia fascicularis]